MHIMTSWNYCNMELSDIIMVIRGCPMFLCSFPTLQSKFQLPQNMCFYYLQLQHAVKAQFGEETWAQFPTPIFNYMAEVEIYKGFISRCYYMLLIIFLKGLPFTCWLGTRCGGIWRGTMGGGPTGCTDVLTQCYTATITVLHPSSGPTYASEAFYNRNERGPHMCQVL